MPGSHDQATPPASRRPIPRGLGVPSLICSLIRLRPEPFGEHHLERTAQVADPVELPRTWMRNLESVLAHNSGAVGPASAAGLTLTARPPHAGPRRQTPMSDRLQATPILLTQLLTTDLDEHGQRWNCQVAA